MEPPTHVKLAAEADRETAASWGEGKRNCKNSHSKSASSLDVLEGIEPRLTLRQQ